MSYPAHSVQQSRAISASALFIDFIDLKSLIKRGAFKHETPEFVQALLEAEQDAILKISQVQGDE